MPCTLVTQSETDSVPEGNNKRPPSSDEIESELRRREHEREVQQEPYLLEYLLGF